MRLSPVQECISVFKTIKSDKFINSFFAIIATEEEFSELFQRITIVLVLRRVADESNVFPLNPVVDIMERIKGTWIRIDMKVCRLIINAYGKFLITKSVSHITEPYLKIKICDKFSWVRSAASTFKLNRVLRSHC